MATLKYRKIDQLDIKPLLISLGIPRASFEADDGGPPIKSFDAVVNAEAAYPDSVWLFRGGDFYLFDLREKVIKEGPLPIAGTWGGASWPALFTSGIDGAVWAGPTYPGIIYFFKGNLFIRFAATGEFSTWKVNQGPIELLSGGWGSMSGTALAGGGFDASLHDIRTDRGAVVHFFKGDTCIQHNLNTGGSAAPVATISEVWKLPAPFSQGIDAAFYGTGEEERTIYFLRGDLLMRYDTRSNRPLGRPEPLTDRFPALARFLPRPQLFLVESYALQTWATEPIAGRFVESITIPGRTKQSTLMVTESSQTKAGTIEQTIMQSKSAEVVQDLHNEIKKSNDHETSTDAYRYQLEAAFHGDAAVTGLGSGEANANLKASGGSDDVRTKFAEATTTAVESQLSRTSRQLTQKAYKNSEEYKQTEFTRRVQEIVIDNLNNDNPITYTYNQLVQPFLTLLVLTLTKVAYLDGLGDKDVVNLTDLTGLLQRRVVGEQNQADILRLITGELSAVKDYKGTPHSVLAADAGNVPRFDPALSMTYTAQLPDDTTQTIQMPGIVKADHVWTAPTEAMIAQRAS